MNKPTGKRFSPTRTGMGACETGEWVRASDFDALSAECERLKRFETAYNERFERERHLSGGELDECLSEGIAMLEVECERLREDLALAERAAKICHDAVELMAGQLAEAQANDRTAMGYLSEVRAIVGGDDFPAMVANVARAVSSLSECVELIELLSPLEGDTLRRARAAINATQEGESQ